jgi:EmrB/QacA subfamily drug resistance transporter
MIAMTATSAARRGGQPVALAVLMVVLFLTFLDNTVVSVALGSVQSELHAGVISLQWVVGAYALTFSGAMLAFGMVGDEFGRKRVMLTGVAIFSAGSVLCALAPNVQTLIAGRAVMGFGAAASEPGTLSMLRHLYPEERARARAVGVWTAVCGLALALGPVIGGALVGVWNWRAIFWFNLALGLAALAAGVLVLPENADPDAHRVDIPGFAFSASALSALIFAVITAETAGFAAPQVIALLCLSAAAGSVFVWWESRAAHPLLDLRYLRVPRFLAANVVAFCAYFATFSVFFFTALYLAEVVGYSGYQIAAVFLPMTVLMTAASLLAGRWTGTAAPQWSIFTGCLIFGAGLLLTALSVSPRPSYLQLAAALAITGIGVGSTVVPITTSALSAVPPERSGMAASAANTSREVGAVMGVAVLGMLVNSQLNSHLVASLKQLGIPASLWSIIINAIETGTLPPSSRTKGVGPAGEAKLVQEVIHAAYNAFYAGLHAALFLSAGLVFAAGLFTLAMFSTRAGFRRVASWQAPALRHSPGAPLRGPGFEPEGGRHRRRPAASRGIADRLRPLSHPGGQGSNPDRTRAACTAFPARLDGRRLPVRRTRPRLVPRETWAWAIREACQAARTPTLKIAAVLRPSASRRPWPPDGPRRARARPTRRAIARQPEATAGRRRASLRRLRAARRPGVGQLFRRTCRRRPPGP